jgi:hypothetical protein
MIYILSKKLIDLKKTRKHKSPDATNIVPISMVFNFWRK